VSKFDGGANVARMDRMYSSAPVAEQRAKTRAALALSEGERGLDIGCGPGFLACEMGREVGAAGRITGLDNSPDMITAATQRARREGLAERLEFVVGDAAHLELPPAAFDFVVAVQVYLYVQEIERALAEAHRVLRPGGRLVIVDTDWDSCVWLTADRERHRRVLAARVRELSQPHLPPVLPGLLRRAGFKLATVEVHPMLNRRYEPESLSGGLIEATPKIVSRFGIDPAEAEAWVNDLKSRTSEDDYFFSLNRYLFVACRSEP
jgi:ubiquinone/menaquinone biosynthesis C-methylase UbiE